jgi:hypothetical protein
MTLSKTYQTLLPAVERALGGRKVARDFLYAQAYRKMISDGPYVWELSTEERGELALKFYKEFAEAPEEDQDHMMDLVQLVASEMNEMMGPRLQAERKAKLEKARAGANIELKRLQPAKRVSGAGKGFSLNRRTARTRVVEPSASPTVSASTWRLHVYARRAANDMKNERFEFLQKWRATHAPQTLDDVWPSSPDKLAAFEGGLFDTHGQAVKEWEEAQVRAYEEAKTATKIDKSK